MADTQPATIVSDIHTATGFKSMGLTYCFHIGLFSFSSRLPHFNISHARLVLVQFRLHEYVPNITQDASQSWKSVMSCWIVMSSFVKMKYIFQVGLILLIPVVKIWISIWHNIYLYTIWKLYDVCMTRRNLSFWRFSRACCRFLWYLVMWLQWQYV